jgi:hypothetical protein
MFIQLLAKIHILLEKDQRVDFFAEKIAFLWVKPTFLLKK